MNIKKNEKRQDDMALNGIDPALLALIQDIKPEDREKVAADIKEYYSDFISIGHPFILDRREDEPVLRFKPDPMLVYLMDNFVRPERARGDLAGGLNKVWIDMENGRITEKMLRKFYRDIGYSLCGYSEIWHHRGGCGENT